MGRPYKALGNKRTPFVIHSETPVVDQPGPASFDHPPVRHHFERMRRYPTYHLNRYVVSSRAVLLEDSLEAGVGPYLGQSFRLVHYLIDGEDPSLVIRDSRCDDHDPDQQAERVDHTKQLSATDVLAGVESPGQRTDRGCSLNATGIDDAR